MKPATVKNNDGNPMVASNPGKALSETRAWYRVDRRQAVIKPHDLGGWVKAVLELPGPDIRDYFMTVLLTGMRREEALKLAWANVDLTAKTLTILDPKNHQDHTLPLSDYLAELLERRKAVAVSDYVFADAQGRRISTPLCPCRRHQGLRGFLLYPRSEAHLCLATVAESLDIPAYALKRLLNHANGADVTAGYIVPNVERLRDPMQKITDYILKAAGVKEAALSIPAMGWLEEAQHAGYGAPLVNY